MTSDPLLRQRAARGADAPNLFNLPPVLPRAVYGGEVPSRNTDTSRAAAESIKPKRFELQLLIYGFVRDAGAAGLTQEEAGCRLAEHRGTLDVYNAACRLTAGARMTELKLAGMVKDSGQRRKYRSGASGIVWIATGQPFGPAPLAATPSPCPHPSCASDAPPLEPQAGRLG